MRRYTFYLSVALLAFGIGSFVVYFYVYPTLKIKNLTDGNVSKKTVTNETQVKEKLKAKQYLSDKDKSLLLFRPTLNKWLNNQKLDEIVESTSEVSREIKDSNLDVVDERILLQSAQKSYKPSLIDVDGDGNVELAVLSNCSPPEYCELWIFEKTKEDFEVVLSTYTEVENFSLRKSKTKKHFDIETTASYLKSKTSLGMNIYKFDGKQYVKEECYDYIYLYKDKNGELQKLDKPKFIPLHCC